MALVDESDSEDSWYDRMEAECSKNDESDTTLPPTILLNPELNEGDYFEAVQKRNCDQTESGFAPENDRVWRILLQNTLQSSATSAMRQLSQKDEVAVHHLCSWVSSYIPKANKVLMDMMQFLFSSDGNRLLFADDVLHPAVVCIVTKTPTRVEASIFTPHTHLEVPITALLDRVEDVQRETGLSDLVLCGVDGAFYECGILNLAAPKWLPQWVEECGQYVNERVLMQAQPVNDTALPTGCGYEFCELG
jgi:hypothetical protein